MGFVGKRQRFTVSWGMRCSTGDHGRAAHPLPPPYGACPVRALGAPGLSPVCARNFPVVGLSCNRSYPPFGGCRILFGYVLFLGTVRPSASKRGSKRLRRVACRPGEKSTRTLFGSRRTRRATASGAGPFGTSPPCARRSSWLNQSNPPTLQRPPSCPSPRRKSPP